MRWRCSMNKQRLIANLKQDFMLKRYRAQEECEEFIENLRKNSDFDALFTKYNEKKLEFLKFQQMELKHEVEDLKAEIDRFLTINNIDKSRLEPKYDCKICNDTGVAGGRICKCLQTALSMRLSKMSSGQSEFKSFDNCDRSIMDDQDIKAYELMKTWCARYPNITKTNINIMGTVGCGKTYLLECVANELINKGVVVCFKTAFELNELARLYHIGKSYEFSDCINAEILVIDDLGTEPILNNVTIQYLYNLINVRQINNRPTFISTNLDLENILDRYDERIFSRLCNKNLSINIKLTSGDKRIKGRE